MASLPFCSQGKETPSTGSSSGVGRQVICQRLPTGAMKLWLTDTRELDLNHVSPLAESDKSLDLSEALPSHVQWWPSSLLPTRYSYSKISDWWHE